VNRRVKGSYEDAELVLAKLKVAGSEGRSERARTSTVTVGDVLDD
jgi:hypothetical protein